MINEEQPAGSLKGTLPAENTLPSGTENLGQLDILKLALQEGTRSLKTEGRIRNFATFESGLLEKGIDMSKMAGSVSEDIMNFVSNRTRDPNEALQNFTNLVNMIQTKAKEDTALKRETFGTLLSKPGMLADWDDDTVQLWADSTGLGYEVVKKFRDNDILDQGLVDSYLEGFHAGKYDVEDIEDIPTDRVRNEVIKGLDWDKVSTNSSTSSMYSNSKQFIKDNPDASYEELYFNITDKYEDLGVSEIKMILEEEGKYETSKVKLAQAGLDEEIDIYIEEWEKGGDTAKYEDANGDKGTVGTREDLINRLVLLYKEFSKDQIKKMVYGKIPNDWLEEKKNRWINPFD